MSRQQRILSPEEEADLKRLMDEYNDALRAYNDALRTQPLTSWAALFVSVIFGRALVRKISDIHPYLPLLLIIALVTYIIVLFHREKRKRQKNGIRLPWTIKREINRKYNINLEQARAAFANTYGPTALDSLAADNRKRGRSIM